MKKITTLVAMLLMAVATFAQAPQGFSYQAVVRDAQNAVVANQIVELTLTILQGATADAATAVFTETHSAKTNANGLFTLTVGSTDADNFSKIDWTAGLVFLKTESTYGTAITQLLSVPFALYAAKAGSAAVDLSEYAKKTEIPAAVDLSEYAKKTEIPAAVDLSGYALKTEIPAAVDLSGYALKTEIPAAVDLSGYALKTEIPTVPTKVSVFENDANYLTAHQDISGKQDVIADLAAIRSGAALGATALQEHQDISGKVDKEEGKGLSANDFTNELKTKLENVEETYYSKTEVEELLNTLKAKIPSMVANGIALESGKVVDLGLPSGTLWTTCNLGATNPWEYGDYYAWGETTTKSEYSWSTYSLCNGSSTSLTKYCNNSECGKDGYTDALTTLEATDDAATAVLGSDYAMPTNADWSELSSQCYWVWTADYNGQGVAGYIVYKAKADSDKGTKVYSGNTPSASYSLSDAHIFLPAAGYRSNAGLNYAGSYGFYWSASLIGNSPYYARYCYFYSSYVTTGFDDYRYCGQSVRPVRRTN